MAAPSADGSAHHQWPLLRNLQELFVILAFAEDLGASPLEIQRDLPTTFQNQGTHRVFTKVMDATSLGMPGDDEEVQAVTDRNYWETRGTKETVTLADEIYELIKSFAPELELKYNKFYIGLAKDGQPNNFVIFRARKNSFRAEIRLPSSPDIDQQLETAGIDVMDYDQRWGVTGCA